MKAIVIGDPHFQTDNISEVTMFMDKIEELAKKESPDFIVILGDLLHTHERIHTIPLNKAYEFIERMRNIAKTFVLVGNHDMINNSVYLNNNHWMNGLKHWKDVEIVDKVVYSLMDGMEFFFLPYVPPGRFQEALNSTGQDWKKADCIFAHQEFYGCKMGAIVSVEGDKWPENYPYVVSGHIHSRQQIGKNVYYCGASMQHAFGESERNVIAILSWEKKGEPYVLNEVELDLPRKKIIYTDVEAVRDYKITDTKDKIKITISGVYDEFKAFKKTEKYRELVKSGTKVVFKPKKIAKKEEEEEEEKSPEMAKVVDESDFNRILLGLVNKEKNPFLYGVFELVVNSKTVKEEDILFL